MSDFIKEIEKLVSPIKSFMIKNQGNPILWGVLFGAGLLFFVTVYNALQKEK